MRVLQVINSLEVAGAEVMVGDMVPRLRKRGIDVSVAVFRRSHSRMEKAVEGVLSKIHYVKGGGPKSPGSIAGLIPLCRNADVIHSHLYPAQLWTAVAARISGSHHRLITTEHNPDNHRRGKKLWRPSDRWMYTAYDVIACNSKATADALHAWIPTVETRTKVIPNGIALEQFIRRAPRPKALGDPPVAIFVARLEPQKDHATLFRALAMLPELRLQVVGEGSLRPQLEKLANQLGIASRIDFLGVRDDIPDLLHSADIYVHSTHSDGFGLSVLEAMAAGVPVVASAVPGLDWVVGEAGLLCAPGDAAAMSREMRKLLSDQILREKMSDRGVARSRDFTIEGTVDAYVQLYEELTAISREAIGHVASR